MPTTTPIAAAATLLAASASLAAAGDGPVIEVRMIGHVTQELVGAPGDSGLEDVRVGDRLILVATIDLAAAPDLLPETPTRASHAGPGIVLRAQIGTVHLPLGGGEMMILGDISEFGGPIMDRLIIDGGVFADPAPVYGVVNLDPSIIAFDALDPGLDVAAPMLQSSAFAVTPYAAGMQGVVDRVVVRDVTCAADLAAPQGSLDFSDITAFLTAFAAGEPSGDPAVPFGVHDFSDVVSFLQAFGAGCP